MAETRVRIPVAVLRKAPCFRGFSRFRGQGANGSANVPKLACLLSGPLVPSAHTPLAASAARCESPASEAGLSASLGHLQPRWRAMDRANRVAQHWGGIAMPREPPARSDFTESASARRSLWAYLDGLTSATRTPASEWAIRRGAIRSVSLVTTIAVSMSLAKLFAQQIAGKRNV